MTFMKPEIFFDCIILTFLFIALLVSLGILIIIFIYLRPFTTNVSILLTFNTYLTLSFTCMTMVIIYSYNLSGDLKPFVTVKNYWCQLRTYFVNVGFCALYYSCVLQSIFCLFRVVFYKRKLLQSSQFFTCAIVLQWSLSFVIILSNLVNDDYQHLPLLYRCWISFENTRGLLSTASIIYGWPLIVIVSIYTYIGRYVRQNSQLQQKRKKTIERDLLILKRITIFVLVITGIGLPTMVILFVLMTSKKSILMAYHIQGLSMSVGLLMASICFAFISPHIQEVFNRKEQSERKTVTMRSYKYISPRSSQKDIDESIQQT